MANQEQLDILKLGIKAWNQWRQEHQLTWPDLSGADLRKANLGGADLNDPNLTGSHQSGAHLHRANLSGADLSGAHLRSADLSEANLSGAVLRGADLWGANLSFAQLSEANLSKANLRSAVLNNAYLREADLSEAYLTHSNLSGAVLSSAMVGWTTFGNVDLSVVKELETVKHHGPSIIGIDTIYRSQGNIPETFLSGAGVDDTLISYIRSLVGKAIEYYSCFISYSSKDEAFAKRLYADLQSNNVRCWFAPEDMKTGDEIRSRIDEAICIHDKLLLVLSGHSVESTWVKKEVETAFEKEEQQKRLVLFPVRLDGAIMQTTKAWAADIRRMRHITDFTGWKEHDNYQKAFIRLLRDLKAEAAKTKGW